jgi:hypothetical protein
MAAMVSSSRLVFLSAIWIFITGAIAGPAFRLYSCSDNQGNYTSGSAYKANLNLLLSSLSSNSNGLIEYGFYNSSYGEDPDKVYVIGLCRGDTMPDDCVNCLNICKDNLLTQRCPTQKEAIAWYDECMLRYSSRNIFSTMEDAPEFCMRSVNNALDEAQFNNTLLSLLESLRDRAAAGSSLRKFAVGHAAGPNFQTINALVQCTPDLSEQDCNYCLSGAVRDFWKDHAGAEGGRILRPSCNFRYETYGFYNSTAEAPPPSPPPSGTASS